MRQCPEGRFGLRIRAPAGGQNPHRPTLRRGQLGPLIAEVIPRLGQKTRRQPLSIQLAPGASNALLNGVGTSYLEKEADTR